MATIEQRISRDGLTSYRVKIRLKGQPAATATFLRKTDAKLWLQQMETEIRQGRHFKKDEAKRHTLAEAIERYLREVLPSKTRMTILNQKKQLSWWNQQIGAYLLSDLTSALIVECKDRLFTDGGIIRSGTTVKKYLGVLSHLFRISINEWEWMNENPMRNIKRPKEPPGRVRFLSDEERGRLLEVCRSSSNQYLYTIVVLALSTGARKSELLDRTWDDVNLERGFVSIEHTKNGERRSLHLTGPVLNLLTELSKVRRRDSKYIFPSIDGKKPLDIKRPWETAVEKAELSNFRFHDLRHSCASYLAMSGATTTEIAEVLGHKTLSMVKRYTHLTEGHTKNVVERMTTAVFQTKINQRPKFDD